MAQISKLPSRLGRGAVPRERTEAVPGELAPSAAAIGAGGSVTRLQLLARTTGQAWRFPIAARAQTGKPIRAQLREIAALQRLGLRPLEYFRFRLFDDDRVSFEQKREYTGWKFQRAVYRAVNDPGLMAESGIAGSWEGKVDKVLFDCLMRSSGVPTAPILAIFDRTGVAYNGFEAMRSEEEVRGFAKARADRPFFVKPTRATSGAGAFAVERVEDGCAILTDGCRLELAELVARIVSHSRVVIQERLLPHPALQAAMSEAIGTVRVIVLRGADRSSVHRTYVRIPVGQNMVDNFDRGQTGNLSASVDAATGRIERIYDGVGLDQVRVRRHPDSGVELEGFLLPDWEAGIALTLRASRVLSGMVLQVWDLALTDQGPLMMEVNDVSSGDVQLLGPPGLLDRRLSDFLREHGFRWTYPYPKSLPGTSPATTSQGAPRLREGSAAEVAAAPPWRPVKDGPRRASRSGSS